MSSVVSAERARMKLMGSKFVKSVIDVISKEQGSRLNVESEL